MFCRSTDGNSEKFGGSIAFRVKHIKGRLARTASVQVMFNAKRRIPVSRLFQSAGEGETP